ncbi:hypothetical protein B0H14DRAFT_2427686 [Mycena olivaceomarginata]|nr:hypothetical protein B0H14DRAFT_2427686 [Mycena olivaceomarginata]
MKRGFLNSTKAKARPLGPINVPIKSPLEQPVEKMLKFPIGKVEKIDVPDTGALKLQETDPRGPGIPGAMTFTTLPIISFEDDEPVTECFFFPGTKELVMKTPGFPQPLVHPTTPAVRLGAVPGKGMGLFSTRALKMGDLILSERPLLVAARGVYSTAPHHYTPEMVFQHSLNELEKYCSVSVQRMRPENRAAFMALANSHKEDGSGPIVGITRTNGLGISGLRPGVDDGTNMYVAILKDISRLNHSCSANTSPHFDLASFSHRLYAVRDIAAGEELTFQYAEVVCSAAARNEALKPYDFVCTCPACMDAPASDARRAAIDAFTPNVFLWAMNRKLPDDWLIKQCLEQLARIAIEGLEHDHRFFDATKAIMEAYICLGDARNASEWAAKLHRQKWAEELAKADVGPLLDAGNTAVYEDHDMWRMRTHPGANVKMLQQLAGLTGPNNIKTLAGGATLMMFPGLPPGFKLPGMHTSL